MNQKQEKSYKHYARPNEPRAVINRPHYKGWLVTMAILVVVIIALIPVVHHLASSDQVKEQAVELQKTTKKSPKKPAKHVKQEKQAAKSKPKKAKVAAKKQQAPKVKKAKAKKSLAKKAQAKKQQVPSQYVVQVGDTLTSIAQKNNVLPQELIRLNGLSADGQVYAGQTLKLR
ncbi:LysM domain-containing protein [Lactobacillus sp. ESL0731]|uniref:LysM peptidoglycan-binding domain-containing protein n=1 Tax=unclassified Lactobacillus TaxID=2620435 RepID=UPI0023F83147|nr:MULTISPECIES: LysM domain-containing protein [unclassified Lactobacillus]WEV51984.1 LysM domain-containing protein [Lactobacillus sp. ESL0700]WEV63115.1 LysM domain-containing protein [Lactobacillus sp. ESL0731]